MRTMTIIFTTLIIVATASGTQAVAVDQADLIGPPPVYNDEDSHELLGLPTDAEDSKPGGVRCLACR